MWALAMLAPAMWDPAMWTPAILALAIRAPAMWAPTMWDLLVYYSFRNVSPSRYVNSDFHVSPSHVGLAFILVFQNQQMLTKKKNWVTCKTVYYVSRSKIDFESQILALFDITPILKIQ